MLEQALQIDVLGITVGRDRSHAGTAIGVRYLDAVNHRLFDLRPAVEGGFHLGGGDVFALPAKGVAKPVDKLNVLEALVPNQVACIEPAVARLEDVAQQLFLRCGRIGVTLEIEAFGDFGQQQAGFPAVDLDQMAVGIPYRFVPVDVVTHDGERHRTEAGGAVHVESIGKDQVAFRGPVEFVDAFDAEALLEFVPDVRPQAVADADPDLMVAILVTGRLGQQVTTQFADVAEHRGIEIANIVPEATGGEFARQGERGAGAQGGRPGQRQCIVVIQRQATIEHVAVARAQRGQAHGVAGPHPAQMAHHRGLGHARRARGEYVIRRLTRHHVIGCRRIGDRLTAQFLVQVYVILGFALAVTVT